MSEPEIRVGTGSEGRKMWNRCDICGKFIGLKEFDNGTATRNLLTPDSYLTSEEWETIHLKCDRQQ